MLLTQILNDFQTALANARGLIVSAHRQDAAGNFIWNSYERTVIVESAYLRIYVHWETFLEQAFAAYMQGSLSISGKTFLRYSTPRDFNHSQQLLTGGALFVKWTNPESVVKLAEAHFDAGAPFASIVSAINQNLLDMNTVRNAAAHITSTTSKGLDALATRLLRKPVLNITVYDFILSTDPASTTGGTILDHFTDKLNAAAMAIAN